MYHLAVVYYLLRIHRILFSFCQYEARHLIYYAMHRGVKGQESHVHTLTLISCASPVSCNHICGVERTPVPSEGLGHLFVISSCDLCLLSGRWESEGEKKKEKKKEVCSDLLVITQCPPPSRWTTSGQPQHLDGQGGLVITAGLQTLLRIAWKKTTSDHFTASTH